MIFYNKLEEFLLAISLFIMVIINFLNVISRYFIHASISFTEELLILMFLWNTMLASALAFKLKAHLGLSALTDLFPHKFQKYVVIIATAATIILMAILSKFGMAMIQNQIKFSVKTAVMELPEPILSLAIPCGALLVIIRIIETGYRQLVELKEGGK